MALNAFINEQVSSRLSYYYQEKYIKEYRGNKVEETEIWVEYYNSEDYKYHLSYLIETWTNYIDENLIDAFKTHYNYTGTFYDLWDYFVGCCPEFDDEWLYDIFERHILVTNLCLK